MRFCFADRISPAVVLHDLHPVRAGHDECFSFGIDVRGRVDGERCRIPDRREHRDRDGHDDGSTNAQKLKQCSSPSPLGSMSGAALSRARRTSAARQADRSLADPIRGWGAYSVGPGGAPFRDAVETRGVSGGYLGTIPIAAGWPPGGAESDWLQSSTARLASNVSLRPAPSRCQPWRGFSVVWRRTIRENHYEMWGFPLGKFMESNEFPTKTRSSRFAEWERRSADGG